MDSVNAVLLGDCLDVRARVCAYVSLFAGCELLEIVAVSGLSPHYVGRLLGSCVDAGFLSRGRVGRVYVYRLLKSGRKFIEAERLRMDSVLRDRLVVARSCATYPRLDVIASLESGLKKN